MKFPSLNKKTLKNMTPAEEEANAKEWTAALDYYTTKYPEEFKIVMDAFEDMWKRNDEPEKETDKPATYVVGLSTQEKADIEKKLMTRSEVVRKFDGDKHKTKFRKVNGELMAFEPNWPQGRKVITETDMKNDWKAGMKPGTDRAMLRWFYDEFESEQGAVCYRLYEKIRSGLGEDMPQTMMAVVFVCCLMCLVARKNDIRLMPMPEGFAVAVRKDADKEILRDVLCMTTCVPVA